MYFHFFLCRERQRHSGQLLVRWEYAHQFTSSIARPGVPGATTYRFVS